MDTQSLDDGIETVRSAPICLTNADAGFLYDDQSAPGKLRVTSQKPLAHSDDVAGLEIPEPQEDDTDEWLVFVNGQGAEIGIMSQYPTVFATGGLEQFVVTPPLPSLFLGIQHVNTMTTEKSHNFRRDILVGEESQPAKFHVAGSNSRYTSFR